MKIILNQDIANLGEEGDIKEVAPGYGRNFLVPKKMAVYYNKRNIALFEQKRAAIEKRKAEKHDAARSMKENLEALVLTFDIPAGEKGKLFGSVNNTAISDELNKQGFNIEKRKIEIPDHAIKMAGEYTVRVKLYETESASLKVVVNPVDKN